MPITNAQYDEIMRRYDAKQLNNKRSSEKKIKYLALRKLTMQLRQHPLHLLDNF